MPFWELFQGRFRCLFSHFEPLFGGVILGSLCSFLEDALGAFWDRSEGHPSSWRFQFLIPLFPPPLSIPDSPHEPDPESYEPLPPKLIPLDEVSP